MDDFNFSGARVNLRPNQTVAMATHGDDKGLFVTFYNESVPQAAASKEQGRPVYQDVPYVHILFPGDRTKEVRRPVKLEGDESSPSDPERWPRQWEAFRSQSATVQSGFPITEWPPLTKSQALELKALNIHTVEQLAAVPDHGLNWLGARELRDHAKAFMAAAADGAEFESLRAENESLRTDLEMVKRQLSELMAGKHTTKGRKATEES